MILYRYLKTEALIHELRDKFYFFNCYFYSTLVKENGLERVKKWTKDVNIFKFPYILIPIHQKYVSTHLSFHSSTIHFLSFHTHTLFTLLWWWWWWWCCCCCVESTGELLSFALRKVNISHSHKLTLFWWILTHLSRISLEWYQIIVLVGDGDDDDVVVV
jgi:hypothetical protein